MKKRIVFLLKVCGLLCLATLLLVEGLYLVKVLSRDSDTDRSQKAETENVAESDNRELPKEAVDLKALGSPIEKTPDGASKLPDNDVSYKDSTYKDSTYKDSTDKDRVNNDVPEKEAVDKQNIPKQNIIVEKPTFSRLSKKSIQIEWSQVQDTQIKEYQVEKRRAIDGKGSGNWVYVGSVFRDETSGDKKCSIIDKLSDETPVLNEYRVVAIPVEETLYENGVSESVLGSNVMICIDPGHYAGKNSSPDDQNYHYAEGDFTIKVALKLRDILKETYGIDCYMTRDDSHITLSGYKDLELDSKHISLRGAYAGEKDSNLFFSIHTNANGDNVNGSPTWDQSIDITKTLVIASVLSMDSPVIMQLGNAVGTNLSQVNFDAGIASSSEFEQAGKETVTNWSDQYNDSLNVKGTIVCRLKDGGDYYGVLRGSDSVNIPGLIVEHAYHTVAAMRKVSQEGELEKKWAEADAYGIAYGFGFVSQMIKDIK